MSLVSCAVALYPATSGSDRISFNQLNKKTGNRIRYKKVDAETQEEVESADIIKGYQVDKNVYVTLDDEEIEAADREHAHDLDRQVRSGQTDRHPLLRQSLLLHRPQ